MEIKQWGYVEPLKDMEEVYDFEREYNFQFPESYKNVIMEYNGGHPELEVCFDSSLNTGTALWMFLGFQKVRDTSDPINMWDHGLLDYSKYKDKLVAFAFDEKGWAICFYRDDKSIVIVDKYKDIIMFVARSFTSFMDGLYVYIDPDLN